MDNLFRGRLHLLHSESVHSFASQPHLHNFPETFHFLDFHEHGSNSCGLCGSDRGQVLQDVFARFHLVCVLVVTSSHETMCKIMFSPSWKKEKVFISMWKPSMICSSLVVQINGRVSTHNYCIGFAPSWFFEDIKFCVKSHDTVQVSWL